MEYRNVGKKRIIHVGVWGVMNYTEYYIYIYRIIYELMNFWNLSHYFKLFRNIYHF